MRRLVFIDDDRTELDDFGQIVEGEYDYAKIYWPLEAEKLFGGKREHSMPSRKVRSRTKKCCCV